MDCGTTLLCGYLGVLVALHTSWFSQLDPDMRSHLDGDQSIHHSIRHRGMVQGQIRITLSSYLPQGSLDHSSRHLLNAARERYVDNRAAIHKIVWEREETYNKHIITCIAITQHVYIIKLHAARIQPIPAAM